MEGKWMTANMVQRNQCTQEELADMKHAEEDILEEALLVVVDSIVVEAVQVGVVGVVLAATG